MRTWQKLGGNCIHSNQKHKNIWCSSMTFTLEVDGNPINNIENNSFCQQNGGKKLGTYIFARRLNVT